MGRSRRNFAESLSWGETSHTRKTYPLFKACDVVCLKKKKSNPGVSVERHVQCGYKTLAHYGDYYIRNHHVVATDEKFC